MSTDAASATSVPADLCARYGPTALVVGAGAGLGAAYSAQLAAAGFDLILVDRDASALDAVAADLSCATQTLVVDLAEDGAAATIATAALDDGTVGLVVANAAASYVGAFADQPPGSIDAVLGVNVATTTDLVHRLVPHLRARPSSGLILMSSQSSRRGAPLVAVYAATKAYLAVLAESLWAELGPDGVDVLAVLPGSTRTPGWLSSAPQSGVGTANVMDPDDVVVEALATLGHAPSLIAGADNRAADTFLDGLPRAEAIRAVADVMDAMYPADRVADPSV